MRAATYYRVSTAKQVEEGFGFDAQKSILRELCRVRGWEIVEEYEDPGISGDSIKARPGIQRMLGDAEKGLMDVIVVLDSSRLSRGGSTDWDRIKTICDENGVTISTPTGDYYRPYNPDDDFMTDITGAVNKREKRNIQARMARGRIQALEQGYLYQRLAPYGYRFERVGGGKSGTKAKGSYKKLVIEEGPAEVVRLIFQLCAYGDTPGSRSWGFLSIARHLNERGIPGPTGKRWNPVGVRAVVQNATYRGEVIYERKGRSYLDGYKIPRRAVCNDPNVVPPIVTPELWQAAQDGVAHRTDYRPGRPAEKAPPGLLCSFLRCGGCGYKHRHKQRRRAGDRLARYYICSGNCQHEKLGVDRCSAPQWKSEEVEAAVWNTLLSYLQQPEMLQAVIDAGRSELPEVRPNELSIVQRQLEEIDKLTERANEGWLKGLLTDEEMRDQKEKLRARRLALEDQHRVLRQDGEAVRQREARIESIQEQARAYARAAAAASPEERRALVEQLVSEVVLHQDGRFQIDAALGEALEGKVLGKASTACGASRSPPRWKAGPTASRQAACTPATS